MGKGTSADISKPAAVETASVVVEQNKQMDLLQRTNIKRVQELLNEFMSGNLVGYMDGVSDDITGSVLGGLIPGADKIKNKGDLQKVMDKMNEYIEIKKFAPRNFLGCGDDVYFNVDWEMVWRKTGTTVVTTAIVRKTIRDNMICEKYHLVDAALVKGEKPRVNSNVIRVQDLLAEYMAGNPDGYMAGVANDVKGSMLGGLIPGGDNIRNKAEFADIMIKIGDSLEVRKFEPLNYFACGNDVYFNVNWEFVWKETGDLVTTTAIVRKKMTQPTFGSKMICEKYHVINAADILKTKKRDGSCTIC